MQRLEPATRLEAQVTADLVTLERFLESRPATPVRAATMTMRDAPPPDPSAPRSAGGQLGDVDALRAELAEARREAEEANAAKTSFFTALSHELRTPLNAVMGMTSILAETDLTPEQRDVVSTIRSSGEALLGVVNELLDMAKLEAGKLELASHPYELRVCVEDALELVAPWAAAKQIDMAARLADGLPDIVVGDSDRVRQILVHLLSNAVKLTERGTIELRVAAALRGGEEELRISLTDTGVGIPHDRQAQVFEAFADASAVTISLGGAGGDGGMGQTGLGLAISRKLARAMGGDLVVESAPGVGSVFEAWLPLVRADGGSSEPPIDLRGRTVLVVDASALQREVIGDLVARSGADVVTRAGMRGVAHVAPDVVIIGLGFGDTPESVMADAASRLPGVPVIAARPRSLREVPRARANLLKPVKEASLARALERALSPSRDIAVPKRPRTQASAKALRILLAEDNAVNVRVALHALERLGHTADVAGNGVEVLEALRRRAYDLILMDILMPEMDGLEATRRVRVELGPAAPRIVALTAHAAPGERERCLAAGMSDYVTKPFRLADLAAAIDATPPSLQTMAPARAWIDRSRLQDVGLDGEALREVLTLFATNSPQQLDRLRRAVEDDDAQTATQVAHRLAGSAGAIGAMPLLEELRAWEASAHDGAELLGPDRVEHALGETLAALHELVTEIGDG